VWHLPKRFLNIRSYQSREYLIPINLIYIDGPSGVFEEWSTFCFVRPDVEDVGDLGLVSVPEVIGVAVKELSPPDGKVGSIDFSSPVFGSINTGGSGSSGSSGI
jgi:hypothetical protein